MNRILLPALAAIVLSASHLAGQSGAAIDYGVRPGDQVETTFYTAGGESLGQINGNRIVDRDGNLFFPFVGTVHVTGLDATNIRSLLVERFTPFYKDPVIIVNVKLRVNITGVVGSPGHYLLEPTTTILDALAQAGGVGLDISVGTAPPADIENVRVIREGQTIILNLRPEVADPRPMEMRVQSGDWIFVPPRGRSRVREDIGYWGSLLSAVTSVVAVVALFTR